MSRLSITLAAIRQYVMGRFGIMFCCAAVSLTAATNAPAQNPVRISDLAKKIDKILATNFHAANHDRPEGRKYQLRPRISDEGYLRRAYLVLLGRNPTIEEAREFLLLTGEPQPGLVKPTPDRRKLVRDLTESREFSRQEFRRWIARLELTPDINHPAQAWLLAQFEAGTPIDEWTVEWFRKYTVPFLAPMAPGSSEVDLIKTAAWMDAFTGHKYGCATCHDHPFEAVGQREFVQLAGFFNDQGAIRLPDPWYQRDGKPDEPVPAATSSAKTLLEAYPASRRFAEKIGPEPWPNIGSSGMFGEWLVKPENRAFDLAIANRGWKRVFGVEFLLSLSTKTGQTKGQSLADVLVEILHAVDRDYGKYLQVLMASRIAHLESVPFEPSWTIWHEWVLTGAMARELTVDERHRILTMLETGETEPALDRPMDSNAFHQEAAWLTSADIEEQVTGNPLATIRTDLERADSDSEAVALAFLATVSRIPDEDSLEKLLASLGDEAEPSAGRLARVLWALLMSEEFAWVP